MNTKALFDLSYGVYLVSSKDGARDVGCIANSVIQVTSSPAVMTVSLNKNNYTTSCLQKTGVFAVSVLSEKVDESVIGTFGFKSGKDVNKFDGLSCTKTQNDVSVLNKGVCSYIEGRVINHVDCGSHIIFIAEVSDAEKLSDENAMTYEYYHSVIKGKAPKNAPTYVAEVETVTPQTSAKTHKCSICGYEFPGSVDEFRALPDSYVCPLCSAPKSCFI